MTATTPVRRQGGRGTAALVLACLSLVISLIAFSMAAFAQAGDTSTADNRLLPVQSTPEVASASQVEAVAHITLPPATVLLSAAYSNGLETRLSAKFRMPRAELAGFLASGKFTVALTPGIRAVDGKHNVGGGDLWDPDTAKTVSGLAEAGPTTDGTRRRILISYEAADVVTVYLYAGRN
jgi:hypothetical protein